MIGFSPLLCHEDVDRKLPCKLTWRVDVPTRFTLFDIVPLYWATVEAATQFIMPHSSSMCCSVLILCPESVFWEFKPLHFLQRTRRSLCHDNRYILTVYILPHWSRSNWIWKQSWRRPALYYIFTPDLFIPDTTNSFDIIMAARKVLHPLPIRVTSRHIPGHKKPAALKLISGAVSKMTVMEKRRHTGSGVRVKV
jgi:hypothetical protein